MNSTRLPGKVLREVNELPLVIHIYRRLLACRELDGVSIAWGGEEGNLFESAKKYMIRYQIANPEENLISRFLRCSIASHADAFVRITADCLFHDPFYIDRMVRHYRDSYPQYRGLTNRYPTRTISEGLDAEIYSTELLAELDRTPDCPREGFAVYAEEKGLIAPFQPRTQPLGQDLHLSIDTQEDFDRAEKMLKILGNDDWLYENTIRAYELTK